MAGVLTLSAQNLKTEMEKVSYSLGIALQQRKSTRIGKCRSASYWTSIFRCI